MKIKLPPFPGRSAQQSFVSSAWSKAQALEKDEELFLISGSEGGQLCIWNVNINDATKEDFLTGKCFFRLILGKEEDDVGALCIDHSQTTSLKCFAGCGRSIYSIDIGSTTETKNIWDFNDDDINSLSVTQDGTYLASSDDSGEIKIILLKPEVKVYRTLRKHTTICSSVSFRPSRPLAIVSAGLDCTLVVWEDFARCRVGQVIKMNEIVKVANSKRSASGDEIEAELASSYMVNPPLVHCVAISPSGNYLAAGIEDSSVQLFDSSKKTVIFLTSSPSKTHTKGVSQLTFLYDDLLLSGGNDGLLVVWKIEEKTLVTVNEAPAPSRDRETAPKKGKRQKSAKKSGEASKPLKSKPSVETIMTPVKRIHHGAPINWISILKVRITDELCQSDSQLQGAAAKEQSARRPATAACFLISVADSTSDIVVYSVDT